MASGVYWTGQDGNVYLKTGGKVSSVGQGGARTMEAGGGKMYSAPGVDSYLDGQGYTRIVDPATAQPAPQATGRASGGGATGGSSASAADRAAAAAEAAKRAANEASRGNTQKAIDSLGTELDTGYRNIDAEAGSIASKYDKEAQQSETDYNDNTVTNNTNLQKNKQNSLVAAAQGARGLRSVLSSVGALGGDGLKLANRAVTSEANKDIGGAVDTAAGNAQNLDKAITKFRDEDKDRRQELETQKANRRTALEGQVESKRQSYYQKMADLFGEVGDAGNATSFLNRAGDLNNVIAQKTAVAATPFTARTAAFTPGDLSSYLAGAGDMTVSTATGDGNGASSPSTILAGRKEKERKTAPALAVA